MLDPSFCFVFTLHLCFLSVCVCVWVSAAVLCVSSQQPSLIGCLLAVKCLVIGSSVCKLFCLQITCGGRRGWTSFPLSKGTPHADTDLFTVTQTHTHTHVFLTLLFTCFCFWCFLFHIVALSHEHSSSLPVQLHKGFLPLPPPDLPLLLSDFEMRPHTHTHTRRHALWTWWKRL